MALLSFPDCKNLLNSGPCISNLNNIWIIYVHCTKTLFFSFNPLQVLQVISFCKIYKKSAFTELFHDISFMKKTKKLTNIRPGAVNTQKLYKIMPKCHYVIFNAFVFVGYFFDVFKTIQRSTLLTFTIKLVKLWVNKWSTILYPRVGYGFYPK